MKIYKRDKTPEDFDRTKVEIAIRKANYENGFPLTEEDIQRVSQKVEEKVKELQNYTLGVSSIQSMVLDELYRLDEDLAYSYEMYAKERDKIREGNTTDKSILDLVGGSNIEVQTENSNKDAVLNSTQRDLIAGEVSKDFFSRVMYPRHIIKAHNDAIIRIHDTDYLLQKLTNCGLLNLEDMFENNTVINGNLIETPKSFQTACTVATQIVAQVSSAQFGGQTFTLAHISPFIDVSRKKIKAELIEELLGTGIEYNKETFDAIVEKRLRREIKAGVQTIQYQLETLTSTNGQSPFVSINMDLGEVEEGQPRDDLATLIEEVIRQRMQGVKNERGVYVSPAFPKLLYVLDEGVNVYDEDPYFYLTDLSARCSAKRLVPDYISAKKMREFKNGQVYPCMGCRSFLTADYINEEGNHQFYGRFNWGVITLSLPDVALSSGGDYNKFWEIMRDRLNLIREAHMIRYEYMKDTKSDVSPILWQNGAYARLKRGETIGKLFYNNFATVSVGYAGIYETVKYMTGESHTTVKGKKLALEILQFMNDTTSSWKAESGLNFSIYGSPIESTTGKFATGIKKRFGIIEGVSDKDYITNSYHVHVQEEIDAFTKLKLESEFQELSPGGAISYIEMPNMQKNIPAVIAVIRYIYENIMYAELNTKSDYCMKCDFDGEILINDKLEWYCPQCGNKDQREMSVVRRTTGYIGSHYWNHARTAEIADRVLHIGAE